MLPKKTQRTNVESEDGNGNEREKKQKKQNKSINEWSAKLTIKAKCENIGRNTNEKKKSCYRNFTICTKCTHSVYCLHIVHAMRSSVIQPLFLWEVDAIALLHSSFMLLLLANNNDAWWWWMSKMVEKLILKPLMYSGFVLRSLFFLPFVLFVYVRIQFSR